MMKISGILQVSSQLNDNSLLTAPLQRSSYDSMQVLCWYIVSFHISSLYLQEKQKNKQIYNIT